MTKRILRFPPPEKDQKTGVTIRASQTTLKRLDRIRMALIRLMSSDPSLQTPNWPFDFNRDACLRLVLRVFARDYGIDISPREEPPCSESGQAGD